MRIELRAKSEKGWEGLRRETLDRITGSTGC
jgi:uncharacterized UPF0160 family protein